MSPTNKKENVLTSDSSFRFYKETWCWAWTSLHIATSNRNTDDPARQCSNAVCFPLEDKRQLRPDIVHTEFMKVSIKLGMYNLFCYSYYDP